MWTKGQRLYRNVMKELIGKKIKGFKFNSKKQMGYYKNMNDLIGKIGLIVGASKNYVSVEFYNGIWDYPLPEALKHIVEEHDLNNTVIKVLNEEHGKQVIKWWQEHGINTLDLNGSKIGSYYGLVNGFFSVYDPVICPDFLKIDNIKVMKLPTDVQHPQRGDEVFVWDFNENDAEKRIFLAYIEGAMYPIQVVHGGCENDYKNGNSFDIDRFKRYKPIPQKTKLTLQQIADKFGIDVNDLEVKI